MGHKIRYFGLICLFCTTFVWGLSPSCADDIPPVELSLSTMILFAVDDDPDILISKEKKEQLVYFRREGMSDYYPQVQLDLEGGREYLEPTGGQNANNSGSVALVVNQVLFDGFTTMNEVNRRQHLIESAQQDLVATKQNLVRSVVEFYLDILRFQKVSESTENFVAQVDEIVDTISDMYAAGAIGKAMLDYAQSRQASAYVDLNEARSSLNEAKKNLEFLTGPLPPFKAIVPDQFYPENLEMESYVKIASQENSFLKKSRAEIEAMQRQLAIEKGNYYPDISLQLEAEQTHNDGGDIGIGRNLGATVNFSYELFDGFNKKNRVRRVSSQINELKHRDRKIFETLKKDIGLAYNQIIALRQSLKTTDKEIYSNTALQILNKENFRLGSINVIELIEGEERLQDARNRKHRLQRELHQNIYNLLILTAQIENFYVCETCKSLIQGYN